MVLRVGVAALLSVAGTTACRRAEPQMRATTSAEVEPAAPPSDAEAQERSAPSVQAEAAVVPPPGPAQAGSCPEREDPDLGILVTPATVVTGQPFRVVAATLASEAPLSIRIEAEGAPLPDVAFTVQPGVPSTTVAEIAAAPAGELQVVVGAAGQGLACTTIATRSRASERVPPPPGAAVWSVQRSWNAAEEALFSAWVRALFHAERGEELAWSALHEVTTLRERNLLHDHLGWNEDAAPDAGGLHLRPDCADAPYFLRAYFAWKRGLPFAFRRCSRGQGAAPRCGSLHTISDPPPDGVDARKPGALGVVQRYFRRTLAWGVHSGNGRTAYADDDTDFYPVALSRRALRPGTIYADPYGHIFVVVEMMAPEQGLPGVLYAIDGQPDGSITRKRFWEGNFLWNPDPALGGSGFKAFRPVVLERDGSTAQRTNDAIAAAPGYGDASLEQARLQADAFYDRMDALVTPGARDPIVAQREAILALLEAAKVRVTSVHNGDVHLQNGGGVVAMPRGFEIFETTGAWENYATPARDLRLLIAIDLVEKFDAKVRRNADVFLAPDRELEGMLAELRAEKARLLEDPAFAFEYIRSDGSRWSLGLDALIQRARALEVGYNPNDCPEVRWGAAPGSPEMATCRRRAPAEQRRAMEAYRTWFAERRRPSRGDPGPSF